MFLSSTKRFSLGLRGFKGFGLKDIREELLSNFGFLKLVSFTDYDLLHHLDSVLLVHPIEYRIEGEGIISLRCLQPHISDLDSFLMLFL
jgi:hypothetical protein